MAEDRDSLRILIVEDNAMLADSFEEILSDMGQRVLGIESSGEGAVESAKRDSPDLILMDVSLDGHVNGIEAARAIRGFDKNITIIFLTGFGDADTIGEIKKFGDCLYFTKPVVYDELQAMVNELSARRSA